MEVGISVWTVINATPLGEVTTEMDQNVLLHQLIVDDLLDIFIQLRRLQRHNSISCGLPVDIFGLGGGRGCEGHDGVHDGG